MDAVKAAQTITSNNLTVATVVKLTKLEQGPASVLLGYVRQDVKVKGEIMYVTSPERQVFAYSFVDDADDNDKPSMTSFMNSIIPAAYVPVVGKANDAAAVKGRIDAVRSKELVITASLLRHMKEFGKLLIPKPNELEPVSFEEVYFRQGRPTQRRLLDQADASGGDLCIEMDVFMKKEPYQDVKDPRLITTLPSHMKYSYSRYIYAFSDEFMKKQPWYAFGKTPLAIATRVATICSKAVTSVSKTDFRRFDGRVSNVLRAFEAYLLARAFSHKHVQEVMDLFNSQMNKKARTKHGIKYDTGVVRLSGSPETADFNSVDNAFVAYVAYRDSGYSVEESWEKLGIYGGDDGLSSDIETKTYEKAAASVGQLLDIEPVKRFDAGVMFLARCYSPDVWTGDLTSCCDLLRTLSKFHVTVTMPAGVTPIAKLVEKCRGFRTTDYNTPVIGPLVKVVLDKAGGTLYTGEARIRSYHSYNDDENEWYPNRAGDWMVDCVNESMPGAQIQVFNTWIERLNNMGLEEFKVEVLKAPQLFEPPAPVVVNAIVNGNPVPAAITVPAAAVKAPVRRGKGRGRK